MPQKCFTYRCTYCTPIQVLDELLHGRVAAYYFMSSSHERSSISHPKHDLEEAYSRNLPTNLSTRKSKNRHQVLCISCATIDGAICIVLTGTRYTLCCSLEKLNWSTRNIASEGKAVQQPLRGMYVSLRICGERKNASALKPEKISQSHHNFHTATPSISTLKTARLVHH